MENLVAPSANSVRRWCAKCAPASTTGFTLMELLIVMVIIGILTAIALPNYSEYIARGNRTDAKATLLQIAQWQERYRSENNGYAPGDQTVLPASLIYSPNGA